MRSNIKKVLLLISLGIFFALLLTNNSKSNSNDQINNERSIEIQDDFNLKTADSELAVLSPENRTYAELMAGYFPATYSFDNDEIGSHPANWTTHPVYSAGTVVESEGTHKTVMEIENLDINIYNMDNAFASQVNGTIELWLKTTNILSDPQRIRILEGSDIGPDCRIYKNKWQYRIGDNWYDMYQENGVDLMPDPLNDTWMHVRIDFECGNGVYQGLSPDTYRVIINNVSSQDFGFRFGSRDYFDRFSFWTGASSYDYYKVYIDAVGYSWDENYEIGDNKNEGLLLSFTKPTELDWMGYSLDGHPIKTILGNITIPFPDQGSHTVQVFGNDSLGMIYQSDIRHFTIGYDFPINPIHIDGLATGVDAHNWTWTVKQWWCSGSGTLRDPYLIENLVIDGQRADNCIFIENSDVHFKLRNCKVYNSGYWTSYAGIRLVNVNNSHIIDNNCSHNDGYGIFLKNSNNNTISGNIVNYNTLYGIYMDTCDNNIVARNYVNHNYFAGIYLYRSTDYNIIIENNIYSNRLYGITLVSANYNIISRNTANHNLYGIYLIQGVYNNSITENTFNNNDESGILLFSKECMNNKISKNIANENNLYGIHLYNTNNQILSENNAINNGFSGIYLVGSSFNIIVANNVSLNKHKEGIYLKDFCNNNTISGNIANQNFKNGIFLENNCDNNTIIENIANKNGYNGILLTDFCENNNLIGNLANKNVKCGIQLSRNCNFNRLSENYLSNNQVGISVHDRDKNNQILKNIANENAISGINVDQGEYNIINDNIVKNNGFTGIILYACNYTIIKRNLVENNIEYGIFLKNKGSYSSNYNKIIENEIKENNYIGLGITELCYWNLVYNNSFIGNNLHAMDNGTQNQWDNGLIGNFWDDYEEVDANNDGIGDVPYNIAGTASSIDYFPIWYGGMAITPKLIDGAAVGVDAHNWTWASQRSWCRGSGTQSDPYIIENVTIDGKASASCIIIQNSDVYFIIRDCTFYNAGTGSNGYTAIRLINVKNGKIINNDCIFSQFGIYLSESNLNIISDNNIRDCYYGIRLERSHQNTIEGNFGDGYLPPNQRYYKGIYLVESEDNVIAGNFIQNFVHGIEILYGIKNMISYNILESNGYGIRLYYCSQNYIYTNTVNKNNYGIYLDHSDDNILHNVNVITHNSQYGLILLYSNLNYIYGTIINRNNYAIKFDTSDFNFLEANMVKYNQYGIELIQSSHNNIGPDEPNWSGKENVISNNLMSGIMLNYYCVNNKILHNTVSNNGGHGIYFDDHCNRNFIMENDVNHNSYIGIFIEYYNDENDIIGNYVEYNVMGGIYIRDYCDENQIEDNEVNNNRGCGIALQDHCDRNHIIDNNVFYNGRMMEPYQIDLPGILLTSYCDENDIISNRAYHNRECGIKVFDHCDKTFILENDANFNGMHGFDIRSYCVFTYMCNNGAFDNDDSGIHVREECYKVIIGSTFPVTMFDEDFNFRDIGCLIDLTNYVGGNSATYNGEHGIFVRDCVAILIILNDVSHNGESGIFLYNVEGDPDQVPSFNNVGFNIGNANGDNGITAKYCENLIILENTFNDNDVWGIYVESSTSLFELINILLNNGKGAVYIHGCENYFLENTIEGSPIGIYLNNTYGNDIINNSIIKNDIGILFNNSIDNNVQNNVFENNTGYAIKITNNSDDNTIYYNDFIDNNKGSVQAYDDSGGNAWSDENGTGNYWRDYDERYPDADQHQGTWSVPYELDGGIGVADNGSHVFAYEDIIGELLIELSVKFDELEELIINNLKWWRKCICIGLVSFSEKIIDIMVEKHQNDESICCIELCLLAIDVYLIDEIANNPEISNICSEILILLEDLKDNI